MAYRFMLQNRCGRYSAIRGVEQCPLPLDEGWRVGSAAGSRRRAGKLSAGYGRRVITDMAGERARESLRRDFGKRANLKKAARLMRERGLNARQRRQFVPAAASRHGMPVCANPLNREFLSGGGGRETGFGHCLSARPGRLDLPDGGARPV
jgi:transposase InsO family protein